MTSKRIIERYLPLTQKYILIDKNYVSLIDGMGCTCDNCGKLIANIATVKGLNDNKSYSIGLDCLETFLLNNSLLDGHSIEQLEIFKKSLPKVIKLRNEIKDFLIANPFIDSVKVEVSEWLTNWVTINYYSGGKQRWNDGSKFKTLDILLLSNSLNTIKTGASISVLSVK